MQEAGDKSCPDISGSYVPGRRLIEILQPKADQRKTASSNPSDADEVDILLKDSKTLQVRFFESNTKLSETVLARGADFTCKGGMLVIRGKSKMVSNGGELLGVRTESYHLAKTTDNYLVAKVVSSKAGALALVLPYGKSEVRWQTWRPVGQASRQRIIDAQGGDPKAQFAVYIDSSRTKESLRWLCLSAHQGYAYAQDELGDLFAPGIRAEWNESGLLGADRVSAYLWYSLALTQGLKRAEFSRESLAEEMTPAEIAEAEQRVADWRPDPEACR